MAKVPEDFGSNVFINCPFDDPYTPLFHAMVFAVHDVGFRARCALEASDAGQFRLAKIMDIISECKYSIHDLSRTELDPKRKLPRFNMPLELGLDLGRRRYGSPHHKEKVILILDVEKYRYQKFISDISGQDISAHGDDEREIIRIVRHWLRLELDPQTVIIPSAAKIFERYQEFRKSLPSICARLHWDPKDLSFADFTHTVAAWLEENPL